MGVRLRPKNREDANFPLSDRSQLALYAALPDTVSLRG